jgi:hypothetical protein
LKKKSGEKPAILIYNLSNNPNPSIVEVSPLILYWDELGTFEELNVGASNWRSNILCAAISLPLGACGSTSASSSRNL